MTKTSILALDAHDCGEDDDYALFGRDTTTKAETTIQLSPSVMNEVYGPPGKRNFYDTHLSKKTGSQIGKKTPYITNLPLPICPVWVYQNGLKS